MAELWELCRYGQVRHARIEPNGMISIVLRDTPETAEAPDRSPEL